MMLKLIYFHFIFLLTSKVWSYSFTQDFLNGFYWASLPVKFIIIEDEPQRKSMLSELTQSAVEQWEAETGLNLWDVTSSRSSNIIRWSKRFTEETKMDSSTVLAVAVRYTDGPYFAKSEIIINGNHPSFNSSSSSLNKMNIGTTLVHELGHTMGLDHSDNMLAVMAPTLQIPYNGLHSDDIDGMKDAHSEIEFRQQTRFISPLAYKEKVESSGQLTCATTTSVSAQAGNGNMISLGLGMLMSFVRRLILKAKSLFIKSV